MLKSEELRGERYGLSLIFLLGVIANFTPYAETGTRSRAEQYITAGLMLAGVLVLMLTELSEQSLAAQISKAIRLVACAALAFGVSTFFGACLPDESGVWMKCRTAQLVVFYLGTGMSFVSLTEAYVKERKWRFVLDIIIWMMAVIAVLVPGTMAGLCGDSSMKCEAVMKPFTQYSGISILFLTGIAALTEGKLEISEEKTEE